jgi:hypothetical protein
MTTEEAIQLLKVIAKQMDHEAAESAPVYDAINAMEDHIAMTREFEKKLRKEAREAKKAKATAAGK